MREHLAQALAEMAGKLHGNFGGDLRMGIHQSLEISTEKHGQLTLRIGPDLSRTRPVIKQPEFAKKIAGLQFGERRFMLARQADCH